MKKLNFFLAAFIFLAVSIGLAIRLWSAKPLYRTSSEPNQNGLTFIGVFRGLPTEYADLTLAGYDYKDQNRTWVFFEQDSRRQPNSLDVRLVGSNGMSAKLGESIFAGLPKTVGKRIYGYHFPEHYSPEFRNAALYIHSSSKLVAKWQLQGMPEPERLIPSRQLTHPTDKAMGVTLAFLTPILQSCCDNRFSSANPQLWLGDVVISGIDDFGPDKYEIEPKVESCEWHVPPFIQRYTMQIGNGRTRIEFDAGYPFNSSKIAFAVTLRRFRTYNETVLLKDVHIKRVRKDRDAYEVVSCTNPEIETKTGVKLKINLNAPLKVEFKDRVALKVHSDQPADKMVLPKSPLTRGTSQPIQLWLADGSGATGTDFTWYLPRDFNYGLDKVDLPELKLVLQQRLITGEKTMHFLLPAKGAKKGVWL